MYPAHHEPDSANMIVIVVIIIIDTIIVILIVVINCMLLLQTMLYALAYVDQQPLLGSWVWLVGVGSSAAEMYCLYAAYYSPMLLTDKFSSLICSHFILPFLNIFLSACYVRSPPPPVLVRMLPFQLHACTSF